MTAVPVQILLALGTTIAFAVSSVLVRFGVDRSTPLSALFVTVSINVVVLWSLAIAFYDITIDLWSWRYFILAGVFAPVLGRLCNYVGLQRVGVNLTLPISNSNPLISVLLALLLLGESMTYRGGVGALAAVAGGILIASSGNGETSTLDFRYRDLLFPVCGAVIYGSVQLLRSVGMDLVPEPVIGAAVNLTTSWLIVTVFVLATDHRDAIVSLPRTDLYYFTAAGAASSLGLVCLYAALLSGSVVIVTPILNATPLFAFILTYVFLREREPFTSRVLLGAALIVSGVGLLSAVS